MSRKPAQQAAPQLKLPPHPGVAAAKAPEPAAPTPVPDARWSCKSYQLEASGQPAGELTGPITVGQKFLLRCDGPPVALSKEALRLELPKEQRYSLRILETRSLVETQGDFIATTWVGGDQKLEHIALTDGTKRVSLGPLEIKTSSVITQEKNPENKPFAPWGAQALAWPMYIWTAITIVLAVVALAVWLVVRRSMRRRRLLLELKNHASALSPVNQFNKDLRKITKQIPLGSTSWESQQSQGYFKELDEAFRWFLARELVVPALRERPRAVVKTVKKTDPKIHKEIRRDLLLALDELDKTIASSKPASVDDAQQLGDLCRKVADQIAKARAD
jgi:hypothetical protein